MDFEKLNQYWASAVNVESSNPCVGPIPRINISFLLLSIRTDEMIKIIRQVMKILNANQIQHPNHYIYVDMYVDIYMD